MRSLTSTLKQKLSVEDTHMYCTGRENVPPFSYRMENCAHLSAQLSQEAAPSLKRKTCGKCICKEKKRGQVVKNVSILYLLDPGGMHGLGILKTSRKTYTCLPDTPQVLLLQIMNSTIIKIFHFSNH